MRKDPSHKQRRGAILVLAAIMLVTMFAFLAFAIDVGYISLARTQVQNAADSAALAAITYIPNDAPGATAAAEEYAAYQSVGGKRLAKESVQSEFGEWDLVQKKFTPSDTPGNAIRVTCMRDADHGGAISLFFAPVLGMRFFDCKASAVAMTNPRDIAFVIDLSGSMNNDTEPAWATTEITNEFGPQGYPTVATDLMKQVYQDFGYGTFPGTLQYVGAPLGIAADSYAYAEMTKNNGPLTPAAIPAQYRITNTMSESQRKTCAYKWIIDNQIAKVMLGVKPTANSATSSSFDYWSDYLDYIMQSQQIKSTSPKGKPRPAYTVTLPPSQAGDRISGMGNPYRDAFPSASSTELLGYQNQIGYRTYVQFMMDFGRSKKAGSLYVPLSLASPDCPMHNEATDGGTFSFPPREQPTHAAARAFIAAMQVIKERNEGITDPNQRDWVSIISFDTIAGTKIVQPLTSNYDAAMQACTTLQAVGDDSSSTATETGLIAARNHIVSPDSGGSGRRYTNKVVVFVTDGLPNLQSSSDSTISTYINKNPDSDYYSSSYSEKNAALMQCATMQGKKWQTFPVGLGLGCDYEFMDRAARMGGTSKDGQSPRGSGNPAAYEQRLREIFENIIANPKARLVQ